MSSKLKNNSLSNFEWLIMNQIWELGSASAREVLDALPVEHHRAYTTIQTYTERLVEKGYLNKKKVGLVNFYQATMPRMNAVQHETRRFVDQVFGGSMSQLAAYLLGQGDIKPEDIEQMKALLEDQDD